MSPEQYIKEVTKTIEDAIERLNKAFPKLQSKLYDRVLELTREFDVSNNNVKATTENIRRLVALRLELDQLLNDPQLRQEVQEFKKAFDKVEVLNKTYFSSIAERFGANQVLNELKTQVIQDVEVKLSNQRLSVLLTDKVHDILRVSVTSGQSYVSMLKSVRTFLETNSTTNEFARYAKTITTDALNQYNASYTKIASEDLGLKFYQYVGSLLETSREFCKQLTDQRWVHVSEIPELLKGHVNGEKIPLSAKTGLPYGMIDGTNKDNFQVRRGGHNCGHQLIPVSAALVPDKIKAKFANA